MLMSLRQVVAPQLPFRNTSTKGAGWIGVAMGIDQNQPEEKSLKSKSEVGVLNNMVLTGNPF